MGTTTTAAAAAAAAALLYVFCIIQVSGHVALLDPPARNVLWRSGYSDLPKHQDDDYLLCQEKPSKRCPPCGDSADSPKPLAHQAGGKWALGIIARNYTAGESIPVSVAVTNSHGGHMEFKLCPNNNVQKSVTQRCLDQHPLEVKGYPDGRIPVSAPYQKTQDINVEVVLPRGMTCSQCVLQMSQYAEQFKPSNIMFRNCADIGIIGDQQSSYQSAPKRSGSSNRNNKKPSSSSSVFGSSSSSGSSRRKNSNRRQNSSRRQQQQQQPPLDQYSEYSFFGQQSSSRGGPSPFPHFSAPIQTTKFTPGQNQFNSQAVSVSHAQPSSSPRASSPLFSNFPSQSKVSSQESHQRFFKQQPQQFLTQNLALENSRLASNFHNSHARNERRPTPVLFNTSPSAQSLNSQRFSSSQQHSAGFHTPRFSSSNYSPSFADPKLKFTGANPLENFKPNTPVKLDTSRGFSGASPTYSDSTFHSRSKSMFPIHEPQLYHGL